MLSLFISILHLFGGEHLLPVLDLSDWIWQSSYKNITRECPSISKKAMQ